MADHNNKSPISYELTSHNDRSYEVSIGTVSFVTFTNRQQQARRAFAAVEDGIGRDNGRHLEMILTTCVEVSRQARKVAAGHLESQPVTRPQFLRNGAQSDFDFIDFACGRHRRPDDGHWIRHNF